MISIESILSLDSIHPDLHAGSQRYIFERLIDEIGEKHSIDKARTVELLVKREKLGSAIGKGVAIPHALIVTIEEAVGSFARLRTPLNFDAPDEAPVDLIFLLLVVESQSAQYARLIAHISKIMGNPRLQSLLRRAKNQGEIHDIFKRWERDAA